MLKRWTEQIQAGRDLPVEAIEEIVAALTNPDLEAVEKAAFLVALHEKGETPEEIAAFAQQLRRRAVQLPYRKGETPLQVLDVVGTGGDRLGTLNFSTAAALVAAAAGVPVAKHGNRAITSQAGSADVLEALEIPIDLSPEQVLEAIRQVGFAFLFAPAFHPAFRHVAAARKLCAEQGHRTLFNYLGPLLNPAEPSWMVLGVPEPRWCEPMAQVLRKLGVQRALVVCGEVPEELGAPSRYMDELSVVGDTWIAEFHLDSEISFNRLEKSFLPRSKGDWKDLLGRDPAYNAAVLRDVLEGRDRSIRRAAVLLNAGAALFVSGRAGSILEGWERAAFLIDSGTVAEKLAELSAFPSRSS